MVGRMRIQVVIITAALVWAALLFVEGVDLTAAYIRPISLVMGIVVAGFYGFDRWLWRIEPLPRLLGRPLIAGTWKGELRSNWKDPESGEAISPIPAFLLVHQTYETMFIRLLTAASASKSQTAEITKAADGACEVITTYQNTPQLHLRERSPVHFGAMRLEVHGWPPAHLEGSYWTDRKTQGEVSFTAHVAQSYSDFASATQGMASQ
jgi:hypothetical protein